MIYLSGKFGNKLFTIAFLLGIGLFLYAAIPFIFMGLPTPIFQIFNDDVKSHEVTVEVFNQDNKSVINKTYILESEADFLEERPLSLCFPQEKREFVFKVTIDKQNTNTSKILIPNPYTGATIRLYSKNYESGENIPVLIETAEQM